MKGHADREQQGLLAAILAEPDDDVPRLVYADWLDEHGDEARAEFIRVQVELARMEEPDLRPPSVDVDQLARDELLRYGEPNPRRDELRARERALLYDIADSFSGSHYVRWADGLPGWGTRYYRYLYRRGFVAHVEVA